MRIVQQESALHWERAVVALGTFDGVHRGHAHLLRTAVRLAAEHCAPCVVLTFDRHPLCVLCPARVPPALSSLEEKAKWIKQLGADALVLRPFTAEFAAQEPERYLEQLHAALKPVALVVGENYSFGRMGRGSVAMLRALQQAYGWQLCVVEPVRCGEEMISSSRIRAALAEGNIAHANAMLGRPYALEGQIECGGAFVPEPGRALPLPGAYDVLAQWNQKERPATLCVGETLRVPELADLSSAAPVRLLIQNRKEP